MGFHRIYDAIPAIPSGNLSQFAMETWPIEILDLPIKDEDFPERTDTLPEGTIPPGKKTS